MMKNLKMMVKNIAPLRIWKSSKKHRIFKTFGKWINSKRVRFFKNIWWSGGDKEGNIGSIPSTQGAGYYKQIGGNEGSSITSSLGDNGASGSGGSNVEQLEQELKKNLEEELKEYKTIEESI